MLCGLIYFIRGSDRLLCVHQYQPWGFQSGVLHLHHTAGGQNAAAESEGNKLICDVERQLHNQ